MKLFLLRKTHDKIVSDIHRRYYFEKQQMKKMYEEAAYNIRRESTK